MKFDRQSFLGVNSQSIIQSTKVGIVGLGGGGSHVVQQLAHIGFLNFVIFDNDKVEETNLNRLVGAHEDDIGKPKTHVAQRVISNVNHLAVIDSVQSRWQDAPEFLRSCDIAFGCVDGLQERDDLERACRRYLIPYIDIGMGVHTSQGEPPRMGGQIILSIPGSLCFRCMGLLKDKTMKAEGERYGDAGPQPQVVWANGVLASTAVGVAMEVLTGWSGGTSAPVYLSYVGNDYTLSPHARLKYLQDVECHHFPASEVGTIKV